MITMKDTIDYFRNGTMNHCPNYLLQAAFTKNGKLMLEVKPFADLEVVIRELRDEIMELANLEQHLDIYLYKFGGNDLIEISIN